MIPKKAFKAIQKGLINLSLKIENQLDKIQFFDLIGAHQEMIELMFGPLNKFLSKLKSIEMINSSILNLTNGGKTLGGLITNIKSL